MKLGSRSCRRLVSEPIWSAASIRPSFDDVLFGNEGQSCTCRCLRWECANPGCESMKPESTVNEYRKSVGKSDHEHKFSIKRCFAQWMEENGNCKTDEARKWAFCWLTIVNIRLNSRGFRNAQQLKVFSGEINVRNIGNKFFIANMKIVKTLLFNTVSGKRDFTWIF